MLFLLNLSGIGGILKIAKTMYFSFGQSHVFSSSFWNIFNCFYSEGWISSLYTYSPRQENCLFKIVFVAVPWSSFCNLYSLFCLSSSRLGVIELGFNLTVLVSPWTQITLSFSEHWFLHLLTVSLTCCS